MDEEKNIGTDISQQPLIKEAISTEEKSKNTRSEPLKFKPKALVASSGGVKGFYQLGALVVADEKYQLLSEVDTFAGTSVGAAIMYLLAIGYSPYQIFMIALHTKLISNLSDISISKAIQNSGILENTKMIDLLTTLTKAKMKTIPTLLELKNKYGKHFIATTVNLTNEDRLEYLDYNTYPDLNCITAVIMSMTIPGIFEKMEYKGCLYVDGALANPYPINYVDDGKRDVLGVCINMKRQGSITKTEYFCRAAMVSMDTIKEMLKAGASDKCKTINIMSHSLSLIDIGDTFEQRVTMFYEGMDTGRKVCSTFV